MKIITKNNVTDFCLDSFCKTASIFTPIREVINYRGADYEVRVNSLSDAEQGEVLNINITNPNLFYSTYLTSINTVQSIIEEKTKEISEHFGKPGEIEIEAIGLRLIISTPTDNIRDARVTGAHVLDLKEVLRNIHPADFFNIKKEAMEKAKQYFERQNELV